MNDEELSEKYKSGASVSQLMRDSGLSRYKIMSSFLRTGTQLRENASARVPVELSPDEVPDEHRHSFHFETQFLDGVGGNRRGLVIERECSYCPNVYTVPISQIRGDLGRGRRMRAGKCGECRGTFITKEGYIWIHKPKHPNAYNGRYVPEHILVMEEHLGRYLNTAEESVHHIDGDRSNNDISNLQLRTRYHGKGQKRVCGDCGSSNVVIQPLD
jgi:hypothetical protein